MPKVHEEKPASKLITANRRIKKMHPLQVLFYDLHNSQKHANNILALAQFAKIANYYFVELITGFNLVRFQE